MTPEDFERLRQFTETGEPIPEAEIAATEAAIGCAVPPVIRQIWSTWGCVEISTGDTLISMYGPADIEAFVEDYADSLPGLVPFASDGGSDDWCWVHPNATEPGLVTDSILLVGRGDMTWNGSTPVGKDASDFFRRRMLGQDPFELPNLGQHWSMAHRHLAALPPGVTHDDVDVQSLHYRTLSPRELRPKRTLVLSGVPCKAGKRVLMTVLGQLSAFTLAQDALVLGVMCMADREVVVRDDLHRFTPVNDIELDGIVWAGGHSISRPDALLRQSSGVLAQAQTLDGIPLAADTVRLNPTHRVLTGTTSEATAVDGIDLPAGTRFERMFSVAGEPRLFSARATTAWSCLGKELEPGERFYPHEHR
ncbi:MAG: hypothetical protein KC912_21210 [Proteobacteria bacterium]|nr:hypothetical protein [Pseudomonadota bacterium]